MPYIPSAHDIYPVGIATIDTHRTLEEERRDKLSYSKRSYKPALWVSSQTSIVLRMVSWLRGVEKSTQRSTIVGVTSIIEFRIWKMMLKLLPSLWYIYLHVLPCQSGWAVSLPWYVCCWLAIGRSMIRLCPKITFNRSNLLELLLPLFQPYTLLIDFYRAL